MKRSHLIPAAILAGVILSGSAMASAAEQSDVDLQIIAIEVVPQPQTSQNTDTIQTQENPGISLQIEDPAAQRFGTASSGNTTDTETEPNTSSEPAAETETEAETEEAAPRVPQKLYEIASALGSGYVLDIRHCTFHDTDSQTPQLYRSLNVDQQKFYLDPLSDGSSRICVLHTGDALTACPDDGSVRMAPVKAMEDAGASTAQSWSMEKTENGCCYIKNEAGQYLTLGSLRPYSGASLVLEDFNGKPNQTWKLKSAKSGAKSCADTDLVNPYGEDGPYGSLRLSLLFGETLETITADDLAAQISENEEHQLVLDSKFLNDFVARLAAKYDTQGQPKSFRTSQGEVITLYKGDFGWKLDTAETLSLLKRNLKTNQVRFLAPVWEHRGWSFDSSNMIGDSYVEVDLTNQKVFLYKDGQKLLETDCVSGTEDDPECKTPGGVYNIYHMASPDTLDGPGYSEEVTYWMPFYLGYGLHDATWREEFGKEIYLTDGSHGCINLPLEAAGLIYNTVDIGFPVVLYR